MTDKRTEHDLQVQTPLARVQPTSPQDAPETQPPNWNGHERTNLGKKKIHNPAGFPNLLPWANNLHVDPGLISLTGDYEGPTSAGSPHE